MSIPKLTVPCIFYEVWVIGMDLSPVFQAIIDASKSSMGMDISPVDLINIDMFAARVIALTNYRKVGQLSKPLCTYLGGEEAVLRIWIRWIRKISASWIRIRISKNMRIHGSVYEGSKINQKL